MFKKYILYTSLYVLFTLLVSYMMTIHTAERKEPIQDPLTKVMNNIKGEIMCFRTNKSISYICENYVAHYICNEQYVAMHTDGTDITPLKYAKKIYDYMKKLYKIQVTNQS